MDAATQFGFDWGFLEDVSRWTLGVGVVTAALGAYFTRDIAFAVGCLLAVGLDVALVTAACRRARDELRHERIDAVAPIVMLGGRFLVKAGLLTLAFAFPRLLSFPGTVAGVVTYDITLAFVGSLIALSRGFGTPRVGR